MAFWTFPLVALPSHLVLARPTLLLAGLRTVDWKAAYETAHWNLCWATHLITSSRLTLTLLATIPPPSPTSWSQNCDGADLLGNK